MIGVIYFCERLSMSNICLVACMAKNNTIGQGNSLPWHLPADLQHFKALTLNKPVLMGRKTFASIVDYLGKPLPKRQNIVVTHNASFTAPGCAVFTNLTDALAAYRQAPELCIIGGSSIYEQTIHLAESLHLTVIHKEFSGDAFFPKVHDTTWQETAREDFLTGELPYSFITYKKRHKLIILDRDGVINEDSVDYIKSADEWQPIPGSLEAIAKLTKAGFQVVVATNQSGLARGYFDGATLQAMHDKMHRLVEQAGGKISAVAFCPHLPDAGCHCRKPNTGLIEMLAEKLNLDPQCFLGAPFVGDSFKDLQAATTLGAQPILVKTGKGEQTAARTDLRQQIPTVQLFDSLHDYVTQCV
jgi:D-glycero-D-manno-heptose 1,7-bisphosphate phosphatase